MTQHRTRKGQPCFANGLSGIVGFTTKEHVFFIGDGWANFFPRSEVTFPEDGKPNEIQQRLREMYHEGQPLPRCKDCVQWSSVGNKGTIGRCCLILPEAANGPRKGNVNAFLLPGEPQSPHLETAPDFSCSMGVWKPRPNGGGAKNGRYRDPRQFTV